MCNVPENVGGRFKSALNLACYPKKFFASVEIDSELEMINERMRRILTPARYAYIPAIVLIVVGVIVTSVGVATSIAAMPKFSTTQISPDWTLVSGMTILLFGFIAIFAAKGFINLFLRRAFQEACIMIESINEKYSSRGLKWRIQFSKVKSSGTSSDPASDVSTSCLSVPSPLIYIELPAEKQAPNQINEHSHSENNVLSNTSSDRVVEIEMVPKLHEKRKTVYCTHCGYRTPAPSTPLHQQPLCQGCNRPLELPSRYFAGSESSEASSYTASSPLLSPQSHQQVAASV